MDLVMTFKTVAVRFVSPFFIIYGEIAMLTENKLNVRTACCATIYQNYSLHAQMNWSIKIACELSAVTSLP
jgi:hypothetical protein